MKSKLDRRGPRQRGRAVALVLLAAAAVLPRPALAAEAPLNIVLDQATLMKLPEKVSTIVVGNPLIADVAVQSGGLVVVTGKGYGTTNLIVLDRTGTVLMERSGRGARPRPTTRCRSIAASSARPIAARRTASAASRSAIPPSTSRRQPARPTRATAQSSGGRQPRRRRADALCRRCSFRDVVSEA